MKAHHLCLVVATALTGCGHHYLHLRDGTALECDEVRYAEDLEGWLAQLSATDVVVLVDGDRVRVEDPITDSDEGAPVVRDADPGDASRLLADATGELVAEMLGALAGEAPLPVLFLALENATPRRLSAALVDEAATAAVDERGLAITGARRAALLAEVDARATDPRMSSDAQEISRFYGAALVVAQRASGGAPESRGEPASYQLAMRAFDADTGEVAWEGTREWSVRW